LPEECDALFLEEEIGYEIDNLTPNQVLIDIASKFTRAGGQVVLVSDMYLDGDSIEKIVNGVICKRIWKKIYSSSDLIVSKRSGKIFKKVEKDLDVESTGFVHLGDSFTGDVMKPRQAGWSAIHFPVSEYELVDRRANLDEFIVMMANKGFDVSGWAKI
jgi:predicted HAD superfamily hydrolase